MYARVSSVLDWIDDVMSGKLDLSQKQYQIKGQFGVSGELEINEV